MDQETVEKGEMQLKKRSSPRGPAQPEGENENEEKEEKEEKEEVRDLLYSVDEVPPWYLCILLGFQHYLTMVGATLGVPILLAPALCMGGDNAAIGELLSTIFFVSGIVTLLQTTIGVRLPIVQGTSFGFITPTFAILALPQFQCPTYPIGTGNWTNETIAPSIGSDEYRETWQIRIREIQGAIAVSAIAQVVIGSTGLLGVVLRFIGPLTITPTITLIGISLFKTASDFCAKQWWIAIMTMFLLTLFSQLLRNINLPTYSRQNGCSNKRKQGFPLFKLFPVILAVGISWFVCFVLTVTNVLPQSPTEWGHYARTDIKLDSVEKALWFRFPYPFQWGLPTVGVASVFGMMAAILSGMIESVGDYYACAKLSGAPPPPVHAVNRGITMEGFGCILAGIWGTGSGTTSFSENVGAIGITKVGSRAVVMTASLIMICLGMLGKFGAFFVMIPDPVIGGVFMVVFGMVTAVGLSNLQYVDLNSSRNLFVVGFSCFFGFSLPQWLLANQNAIQTGNTVVNQIIQVLFSTSTFVGGLFGVILDNVIPGTPEERGILAWNSHLKGAESPEGGSTEDGSAAIRRCYDIPLIMPLLQRLSWTRFIPICPTFVGCCTKRKYTDDGSVNTEVVGPEPTVFAMAHMKNGQTNESIAHNTPL